jgi:adenylate cyclase class IV
MSTTMARKLSTQLFEQFSGMWYKQSQTQETNVKSDTTRKMSSSPKSSSSTHTNEFRALTLIASCADPEQFEADVFSLTDSLGHFKESTSTYFNVLRGELKLQVTYQKQNQSYGQLIAYKRIPTSVEGVYLAEGSVTGVESVENLKNTLHVALSELGTLNAKRRVFATDKITIHLDEIEELGTFIEIDIPLTSEFEPTQEELTIMSQLQCSLHIKPSHIIPNSYLDLYRKKKSSDSGVDEESSD